MRDFRQVVLSLLRAANGAELPSAAFDLLCEGGVALEGSLCWALPVYRKKRGGVEKVLELFPV